jgi:hypothetical protein
VVFARQAAFGRPGQPVTFVFSGPYRSIDHPTFRCVGVFEPASMERLAAVVRPRHSGAPPAPGGLRHLSLQLIFSARSVMHRLDVWH